MPNGGTVTLSFDEIDVAGSSDLGLSPGGTFDCASQTMAPAWMKQR